MAQLIVVTDEGQTINVSGGEAASSAAVLATAAKDAAEQAQAMAELASDIATSAGTFYNTKAAATSALGSIGANAYVTVLADESEGGARTVYQKSSGALALRANLSQVKGKLEVSAQDGTYAAPTRAADLTSGANSTDVTLRLTQRNGGFANMDLQGGGTGNQIIFRRPDGYWETVMNEGNALVTAMWIDIAAGLVRDNMGQNGVDSYNHPNYRRFFPPCTERNHMFGVFSDTACGVEIRPAPFNNPGDVSVSYLTWDGFESRADMPSGEMRWARTDSRPFVGDIRDKEAGLPYATGNTADQLPIRLRSHKGADLYGLQVYSGDPGTIGAAWWFLEANGGLACADGKGVFQWEGGLVMRFGRTDQSMVLQASSQVEFQFGTSVAAKVDPTGYHFGGKKVVGTRQAAIANATDAASTTARLNDVLAALRAHGLIET